MTALCLVFVLSQVPAKFERGTVALRTSASWLLVMPSGEIAAEIFEIDGAAPTSVSTLSDGTGIVFSRARTGKKDGLFLARNGAPSVDLSISNGFHGWPRTRATRSGYEIYFVHNEAPDSGPIGAHGDRTYAQLWVRTLSTDAPVQLTSSPGCKAAPTFSKIGVLFEHNSCRGTNGLEFIRFDNSELSVPAPNIGREEYHPSISPDSRWLASVRRQREKWQVVLAEWPSLKNEKVIRVTDTSDEPSIAWAGDSKSLFVGLDRKAVKLDTKSLKEAQIWIAKGAL